MRLEIRGDYPPNRDELHDQVRAHAGGRCIRCGHPNETVSQRATCDERCTHPRDGKQRILTVHHLDGDKSNNRWWNLLALCQSCHLTIQARVIPERPWLFEHSRWFVPYVCGFYAWYYGQLEITREQAEAEAPRWLQLGQPWLAVHPSRELSD
jgi:hypothetical protein